MTGKVVGSKSERALELSEKGLANWQIAERIGAKRQSVAELLRVAKARREREIERNTKGE